MIIIASSFDFQGSEEEISPLMPDVAKMLHLISLCQRSNRF